MLRTWSAIALGAMLLTGASAPASAKLNSCDGPIVLGTTISLTGINSTLAGRWDKLTDMFEQEFNKTGGVFVSSCNKKLPIKFVYYDDQSIAATAVSLYESWRPSTMSTSSSGRTGRRTASRSRRSSRSTRSRA